MTFKLTTPCLGQIQTLFRAVETIPCPAACHHIVYIREEPSPTPGLNSWFRLLLLPCFSLDKNSCFSLSSSVEYHPPNPPGKWHKEAKIHTLSSGTSPYKPFEAVSPPPPSSQGAVLLFATNIKMLLLLCQVMSDFWSFQASMFLFPQEQEL